MHRNYSTYLALVTWGAMAFTSQPNFSGLIVHFVISPVLIAGIIFLARTEGKST